MSADKTRFRSVTNELIALSRSRRPDRNSWQAVKHAILKAATYLREETGQISPPIALRTIEKLCFIQKSVVFDSEEALDAVLAPVAGGFVLRLKREQSTVRRRFSIAHEIGHTFFYNLDYDPPERILSRVSSQKEEDICSAFARELLMPSEVVQQDMANLTVRNLQAVIGLSKKYMVSPEVFARRLLLDMSEFQNSILLFKDPGAAKGKDVWWFYGSALRRYLRKEEKAVFGQVVQATREGSEPQSLKHIDASDKTVSIEYYQSTPNSRLMILLSFRRDDRSTTFPSVSSSVKSQ